MRFELKPYYRNISEGQLLSDLRRVSNILKTSSFSIEDYKKHGKFSADSIRRKFGSWNNALEKIGLKHSRNYGIAEEEYLKNIGDVWIKLGRQPYHSDMQIPFSKYSGTAYLHKFGRWRTALEEFVEYANQEKSLSSKELNKKRTISPNNKHKTKRSINWRLRFIVMQRDNFKCKCCGRSPATDSSMVLHVDHEKAWAKGGETVVDNLQTLCSICNIGKSDTH